MQGRPGGPPRQSRHLGNDLQLAARGDPLRRVGALRRQYNGRNSNRAGPGAQRSAGRCSRPYRRPLSRTLRCQIAVSAATPALQSLVSAGARDRLARAEEPVVRRLCAGGNRIRTIGPSRENASVFFGGMAMPQRRKGQSRNGVAILGGPMVRIRFPPAERWYGAGGEGDGTIVAGKSLTECPDAPAERLERVPRRLGPR